MTGSPDTPTPPEDSPVRSTASAGQSSVQPIDAEIVVPTPGAAVPDAPVPDYDERGVPSLDHVRDKIEGRYATSLGATELAEDTAAARSLEEQEAERQAAGRAKLEEIRRSLGR